MPETRWKPRTGPMQAKDVYPTHAESLGLPSPELLNQIADRLSRPIPAPAKPPVRTKASWQTLRVAQKLQLKQRWFRPGMDLPVGTLLTITKTDTEGISLTTDSNSGILRWTDLNWQAVFEKVKKERKPR